jgi:hypothetical protein
MVQVSARVGSHKSVKRVGADLLMADSHGKYIADDAGLAFARVGFLVMIGWDTGEERSSGMAAGSILSIGSPTRFWIMRTRSRVWALFGMGALILTVLFWGFVFL